MRLIEHYQAVLRARQWDATPQQWAVLAHLDAVTEALLQPRKKRLLQRTQPHIQGMYIHGNVGAGKTFLMDLFFENLPITGKVRQHFHHWMQEIDAQLRLLEGISDPLKHWVDKLAQSVRVICLDEFMVHDPAQAMMLVQLLDYLFQRGIVLVATSNIPPQDLYQDGFARDRFQKAIDMIQQHCLVLGVYTVRDYRLALDVRMGTFWVPDDTVHEEALRAQFAQLEPNAVQAGIISIQKRPIPFIQCGERALWCDCAVLCRLPRSQLDYLEIADRFDALYLSHVPVFQVRDRLAAMLFMHLIDVLYDRKMRLVMTMAAPVAEILRAMGDIPSCQRTISRLYAMQSSCYYAECRIHTTPLDPLVIPRRRL